MTNMRLKSKILLWVVPAGIASLIFFELISFYFARKEIIVSVYNEAKQASYSLQAEVNQLLESVEKNFTILSEFNTFEDHYKYKFYDLKDEADIEKENINRIFQKINNKTQSIRNLIYVDENMAQVAAVSKSDLSDDVMLDFNHDPVWKGSIKMSKPFLSNDKNGRVWVRFSKPLEVQGKTIGTIIAGIYLDSLFSSMSQRVASRDRVVYLLDKEGKAFFSTDINSFKLIKENEETLYSINDEDSDLSVFSEENPELYTVRPIIIGSTGWKLGQIVSHHDLFHKVHRLQIIGGIFLFCAITIKIIFLFIFVGRLTIPINRFVDITKAIAAGNFSEAVQLAQKKAECAEIKDISGSLLEMIKKLALHQDLEIQKNLINLSKQVAHDIRSPLTALNVVTQHLKDLPEDQRLLIRSAVQRIEDITNDLAGKQNQVAENINDQEKIKVHLLSSLIEPLISEKRVQFRSRRGINIESNLGAKSYGLFGKIQPIQFKRALSNLINNSVEAVGENGSVEISLTSDDYHVMITISDNGSGIPKDILPKLMQKGASFGKESSKEGGSGLGLYHARESIESWGGKIEIESEVGNGTLVTASLPKVLPPDWFVPVIEVTEDMHIVILDDDNSIHQVWQGRFDAMNLNKGHIFHFTSPHAIISWYKEKKDFKQSYLFLCDYELLGNKENGLDVIEQLGIGSLSILVTSRFEEEPVKANCERLGVKLLPKNLAGFVPIVWDNRDNKRSDIEYVLIDDSKINCDNWQLMGKFYNKKVCTFNSPGEFYAMIDQFDRATNIYIDSNLADDLHGEDIAKDIFEKGFNKIYLCTGYSKKNFPDMPWIKDIVGKTPPFINAKYQA